MAMKPGVGSADSVFHRTMTLDVVVMIEGVIEMHLDSGEKRTLKAGDSLVQRATMHSWRNVTPDGGWARWVVFIQAVEKPVKVGELELDGQWH
jgi:quercetin dioxygenase-like cupin family protein